MGWMAATNKKGEEIGVCGDEVWDLAQDFVYAVHKIYFEDVGRVAKLEEILSSIEFVYDTSLEDFK